MGYLDDIKLKKMKNLNTKYMNLFGNTYIRGNIVYLYDEFTYLVKNILTINL